MKIIGIAGSVPSRQVSNEEVIDRIRHHSQSTFSGDLPQALRALSRLFDQSGIESRHWLGPDEHPMGMMKECFERALAQSGLERKDIDLVVYASVGRGFIEPANSTFATHALGLSCRNFDVVNACMGWVSAMDLVNDKMKAGSIQHAVIVNIECFNATGGPGHDNYALGSSSELAYKFPTYTIGDAVTITILGPQAPDNFKFTYIHRPDLADLCTISLPSWKSYSNPADAGRIEAIGGWHRFSSYGGQLHDVFEEMVKVFHLQQVPPSDLHCVVTHTSSPKRWLHWGGEAGFADRIHVIGHRTGNVATASAPLALADAMACGRLKKNQMCLAWIGSAGMVFSAVTFNS